MASVDIRLRLVIRRHGVPEVKLLWPCSCSDNFTISRLLEQVNEVITLESGEWGLEDYAVELADGKGGTFECLHFQPVGRILKDEDQVLIRSLLSDDLKFRKLTGRHQITPDGSHLVDGVAFGRTRFKTPRDRPAVELPPRKRARTADDVIQEAELELELEQQQQQQQQQQQLLLQGPSRSHLHLGKTVTINGLEYDEFGSSDEEDYEMTDEDEDEDDDEDEEDEDEEEDAEGEGAELADEVEELLRENSLLEQVPTTQDNVQSLSDRHGYAATASILQIRGKDSQDAGQNGHLDEDDDEDEDDDDYEIDDDDDDDDDSEEVDEDSEGDEATLDQGLENLEDEILLLRKDNDHLEDPAADFESTPTPERPKLFSKLLPPGAGDDEPDLLGLPNDDIIALLKATFPSVPIEQVSRRVKEMRGDVARVYLSLAGSAKAQCSFGDFMDVALMGEPQPPPEKVSLEAMTKRAPAKSKGPLIQVIEEVALEEAPVADGVIMSPVKKQVRRTEGDGPSGEKSNSLREESEEDTSSEDSDEDEAAEAGVVEDVDNSKVLESSSDETSSSEEESSDESSEDESEYVPVGNQPAAVSNGASPHANPDDSPEDSDEESSEDTSDSSDETSSDSDADSDSGSGSDSDAAPQEVSSKAKTAAQTAVRSSPKPKPQVPDSSSSHPQAQAKGTTSATASGTQTLSENESGNQRPVPPGLGMKKTQKRNARRRLLKQQLRDRNKSGDSVGSAVDELLARKQALLASIASQPESPGVSTIAKAASVKEAVISEAPQKTAQNEPPKTREEPPPNRPTIDLEAGKRLVFGALGRKNPRNKADEEKIKQALMKGVRVHTNTRLTAEAPAEKEAVVEDMESWRDKIIYHAVECCHDGMVLSEPPFPFVQRWDPQQKFNKMRKRKRDSENHYDDSSYLDLDSCYQDGPFALVESSSKNKDKKTAKGKGKSVTIEERPPVTASSEVEEDSAFNDDDISLIDSQFTDTDDLPSLPRDMQSLAALKPGMVKPGMVITWKELVFPSKATNWETGVVSVTGLVLPGSIDTSLRIILAKRDRKKDEREYDELTGERVYGKFEVPDLDDEEEEEEDDGRRTLSLKDMTEPRILQKEPSTMTTPAASLISASAAPAAPTTMAYVMDTFEPVGLAAEGGKKFTSGDAVTTGQVSDCQEPGEKMEVEVEADATQRTTTASQGDRMHLDVEVGDGDERAHVSFMDLGETQEDATMVSFQCGQQMPQMPHFGESSFADELLDTAITEDEDLPLLAENEAEAEADDVSGAMDGVEPAGPKRPPSRDLPQLDGTAADDEADAEEEEEGVGEATDDGGPFDVDGILSKPMFSFAQEEFPRSEAASVRYPHLAISSSQHDLDARPPDLPLDDDATGDAMGDDTMGDDAMADDATIVPDPVLPRLRARTPLSNDDDGPTGSPESSSPFPSIEEIFLSTAASARQRTQPSTLDLEGPAPPSLAPRQAQRDADYEEAMRRLDEGHDSDHSIAEDLFPNSTQPVRPIKGEEQASGSRPPERSAARDARQSFALPAGVDAISISSSSPAPTTRKKKKKLSQEELDGDFEVRDYEVEDEDDDVVTSRRRGYNLPRGKGWKQKFHATAYPSTAPSRSRGRGTGRGSRRS